MGAGVPELIERILELRGISAEGLDEFLTPSIRDLAPSRELPNVDAAAEAILAAAGFRDGDISELAEDKLW
jgi:hypothetical protein